jgi:hypothetical protein
VLTMAAENGGHAIAGARECCTALRYSVVQISPRVSNENVNDTQTSCYYLRLQVYGAGVLTRDSA